MPRHQQRKTKMTTELGLQIETTKTHKEAEHLADLKEKIDDTKKSLESGLDSLLSQMRLDHIEKVTVKAPGGSLYTFEVRSTDTCVKVKKATEVEQVMVGAAE